MYSSAFLDGLFWFFLNYTLRFKLPQDLQSRQGQNFHKDHYPKGTSTNTPCLDLHDFFLDFTTVDSMTLLYVNFSSYNH